EGIGVGVQYIGLDIFGTNCTPSANADVEIGPLPANAQPLADSIAAHGNTVAVTTVGLALQGAIEHTQTWASDHPDRKVVIAMLADGVVDGNCVQSMTTPAEAAAALAGTPSIPTYVIGLVSPASACGIDPSPAKQADF